MQLFAINYVYSNMFSLDRENRKDRGMNMNKIRAIRQEPVCEPEIIEIENDLKPLQEAVGGYIQVVPLGTGKVCVICDEEGRLKKKPFNCVCGPVDFVGTILVVGTDIDDFADVPISIDSWKCYLWLSENCPEVLR